jgi:outer membrane protein assembly factor BamA
MQGMAKYLLVIINTLIFTGILYAQPGSTEPARDTSAIHAIQQQGNIFIVRNIVITGNKKTKQSILLRELPFKAGDLSIIRSGKKI